MRAARSLALLVALSAGAAAASPIRTVSPSTGIFLGNVVVGRAGFVESSDAGREVSARVFSVAGFYSPTTSTLLGLVVPYVEKRLELAGQGEATVRGVGDLLLVGHYRFWNRIGRGYADQAAARLGLKLPSGADERPLRLSIPEPARRTLQPGTGSTDLVFTFAAGREHYRYNLDVDGGYRLNTRADDLRFGDEAFADLSLQAFVFPRWTRARGFETLLGVELGFLHRERDDFEGRSLSDSGGNALFVSPGIQLIATERILFEASLRLPAIEHLRGNQPGLDRDLLVGFRFVFG